MKKPDRFERMVMAQYVRWKDVVGDTAQWHSQDVIALLRKEHAWMKRMVKGVRRWADKEIITKDDITTVILARLAQRKK